MVAMLLEGLLLELGCHVVEVAARVDIALAAIAERPFDIAILDVNLEGELSYPVADELELRGIPFLFVTGYGAQAIPQKYRRHTILQKPFRTQEFEQVLLKVLSEAAGRL